MSIYKRGKIWWIQFTAPDGSKVQRTAGTVDKQAAQELHDRLKAEAWRVKHLGAKPRRTWPEVVIRWLAEHSHKKSIETDKFKLRWLDQHLLSLCVHEITRDKVDAIRDSKLSQGVSNSTVNRTLELLRSILNCCIDWEWLDSAPKIRLLPEPVKRVRWLTRDEHARLVSELPLHLLTMVNFSLATGLRESNVTALCWSQVDLSRRCLWIYADQSKSGKSFSIPLNDDAIALVGEQVGKHDVYVFTYQGNPVTRANNHAWRKALSRAGIENFRWHDLRHTWASWHVQNGTPLQVLMELGGWSDISMVLKYAHLSSVHLEQYAENLAVDVDRNTTFRKTKG